MYSNRLFCLYHTSIDALSNVDEENADKSRSGAFGRVLSYDGQTLSRSEDVGHRFDPFFIQTPSLQMPRAFGEVG